MNPRGEQTILTPSQVGQYIKSFMDRDRLLSGLLVRGELSNYKRYPSGHHYFTLKDGEGALRCVMFRSDAASLRFQPQNGMQVIAAGRVTVFPRDGQYQLYCVRLTPEGAGDLAVAFEQLKARLLQEGIFDPAHKKPIPRIPGRIALVTSPAGAAVRDMLRILGARWPMAQVYVLPVRVQGEEAAEEIAAAETANAPVASLQMDLGEGLTLEQLVGDEGMEEGVLEKLALREAVKSLPDREGQVVALRYFRGLTQDKTARILGVSQVQVSRIERKAMARLRELLE